MPLGRVFAWLLLLGPFIPLALALWLRQSAPPDGSNAFIAWYAAAHPLWSSAVLTFVYVNVLYVVGLLIRNHSIFDFNWSMLPASFYTLHYAFAPSQQPHMTRFWLLFVAVSLWGMRLSANWLYKGGLNFEDFRYVNYRKAMSPIVFQVFAYVALFVIQIALVYGMTTPIYVALHTPTPPSVLDGVALVLMFGGLAFELVADTQQHRFRNARDAGRLPPGAPRFITTGLWRYSRHPNYFGETCVWWGVWLFAVAASGQWLHWSLVGPLTVTGLFLGGSIRLTEEDALRRKPEYAEYQRRTSRFIPWFPRK